MLRNDAGPQKPGLAVGVVSDAAGGVEDHCCAAHRRVGGPGGDRRIVGATVAGESDPGCRDTAPPNCAAATVEESAGRISSAQMEWAKLRLGGVRS